MYAMRRTWFDSFTGDTLKLQPWHLTVPGNVDLEEGDVMRTAHRHAVTYLGALGAYISAHQHPF